jgi:hypothetical protein
LFFSPAALWGWMFPLIDAFWIDWNRCVSNIQHRRQPLCTKLMSSCCIEDTPI